MRRAITSNLKAVVALAALWTASLAVGGYIVAHQRIHPPSWVPIVGEHDFILRARLTSVAGILPGQGQAVTISGVRVGDIAGVSLQDGLAVAKLRIKPKYAGRIYPDAGILLRPKTGLKDMVAELEPGSAKAGPPLHSGALLGSNRTLATVDLDEILASLDADTRTELAQLVGNGGRALGDGGGHDLANTFRRLDPLSRDVAQASRLVARRSAKLRRVMHNLSLLAGELGARDRQLATFVAGSEGSLRHFAAQNASLAASIHKLPGALSASSRALHKVHGLGSALKTTLTELDPTARALGPTLAKTRPFLRATTPVFKNQLRPFARAAQPTAKLLVPAARDLAAATPNLRTLATVLNALVDELAYKPPGAQSTLFYVPWASHDTNSLVANQDAISPLRRGLIALSCGQMGLLDSLSGPPPGHSEPRNPTLATLIGLLNAPNHQTLIDQGQCPKAETRGSAQ
jgi:phospholipid/cholesterol/gamma-HCH transport system substrate-binding protein